MSDIVGAGSWDGKVRVWDSRLGILRRTVSGVSSSSDEAAPPPISDARSAVLCLSILDSIMITGCYDGTLSVFDFSSIK